MYIHAMARKIVFVFASIILSLFSYTQVNNTFNLMPVPAELKVNNNRVGIDKRFRISVTGNADKRIYAEASRFIRRLSNKTGIFLDKQEYVTPGDDNNVSAALLVKIHRPGKLRLGEDETYSIETGANQIVVTANTDLGGIHALETLLQLVSNDEKEYYPRGIHSG